MAGAMIPPEVLNSKSLFALLYKLDQGFAEGRKAKRCPFCGGPLHNAYYQRKPRGGPRELEEAFEVQFGLCCGRPGCRRRVLPPSVRFWGRRVYWAPVMLLVSALRQGQKPVITLKRLKALFEVCRLTVKRWEQYFQELFTQSIRYRRLSGRLLPPIDPEQLPSALLSRFDSACCGPEAALANCLRALALGP